MEQGLAVRPVRARSTPAPTRSSATSPPSASSASRGSRRPCASPSPTTSSPSATPSATSWPRSARPRSCGPPGPTAPTPTAPARARAPGPTPPRWPRSGPTWPRWACSASACPRPTAAWAWPRSTGSCWPRRPGYAALPHPFVETACVVAPLLDDTDDPHGVLAELLDGSRQAGAVPLDLGARAVGRRRHLPGQPRPRPRRRRRLGGPAHRGRPRRRRHARAAPHPGRQPRRRPPRRALGAWQSDAGFAMGTVAERAFDRGALGTAAQLVGLGRRMLDLTVGLRRRAQAVRRRRSARSRR